MVDTNGIISTPNFIQVRPAALESNQADRRTDRHAERCMRSFLTSRANDAQK
jgi:hypothetical protein